MNDETARVYVIREFVPNPKQDLLSLAIKRAERVDAGVHEETYAVVKEERKGLSHSR